MRYQWMALVGLGGLIFVYSFYRKHTMIHAYEKIHSSKDAIALFPHSVSDIQQRTKAALEQAQQQLKAILEIPDDKRTFANTAYALDQLASFSPVTLNAMIVSTLDLVHPDDAMREVARQTVLDTQNFFIDHISSNRQLYKALKAYADGNAKQEELSQEQKYFLQKTLDDFKREGLDLPDQTLQQIKKMRKDLAELEQQFDKNIAQDKSAITVDEGGLAGLDPEFITSLAKNDMGKYIVTTDNPTYLQVMENCTNGATRRELWKSYANRAYPNNKALLEQIIEKRNQLAQLLGFDTYAAFELDDQMVHTPTRAKQFLDELNSKAQKKAATEFKEFTQKLPESVNLTADGKLYPWDVVFLKNQYKKKVLDLDENEIATYFPMQHTIDGLLKIYQDFFNLEFKQLPAHGLWHADVQLIEIINKLDKQTIGYLFLDLFPRPNKYSHACEHTIIPVIYDDKGDANRGVCIVVANFPKPMAGKPSLLHHRYVTTFFHEFGHAIHALLGRTHMASFAGTNVKRDFVELPSQMLEEWMWEPDMLKLVSSHYQTGQTLPDTLITALLKSRTFDSGFFIIRQIYLAKLSLNCFNSKTAVDIDALLKQIYQATMYGVRFESDDHFYASFGHLMGYGARYYGYLWSKVFAHDIFAEIKKEGLLNPVVGQRYIDAVIGKGGSQDPNDLLLNFLHREPKQDAFLRDMGLV